MRDLYSRTLFFDPGEIIRVEEAVDEARREAIVRVHMKRPLVKAGIPFDRRDTTQNLGTINEMVHRSGCFTAHAGIVPAPQATIEPCK